MSHLRLVQDHAKAISLESEESVACAESVESEAAGLRDLQAVLTLVAPAHSAMAPLIDATDCRLAFEPNGLTLSVDGAMHAAASERGENLSCYVVQGLRGVLAGPNSDYSVTLVGVSADANLSQLNRAIERVGPANSQPSVAIDRCIQGAEDLQQQGEGGRVELMSTFKLLTGFDTNRPNAEVIVVPESMVDRLAKTVAAYTGTQTLLVKVRVGLSCTTVSWQPSANATAAGPDASVVLLAAIRLLQAAGQWATSKQLYKAWVDTLKAGYHTASVPHIAPYTWQLKDSHFIAKVARVYSPCEPAKQSNTAKTRLSLVG